MRSELKNVKRIVVKIGTNLIAKNNEINIKYLKLLASQISKLKKQKNLDCVIVSSGAIGLGIKTLNLKTIPKTLPEKQAAAAIGQSRLMHIYNNIFGKKDIITAQVLLTQDDFQDRLRYINAKNTMTTLLAEDVVPIVNENDTISVDEIKFGDNDTLAAHVTNLVGADLLILLTNVDGLMDFAENKVISEVSNIDKNVESLIDKSKTELGTGGMVTKLNAGKIVNKSGEWMIIANGNTSNVLLKIMDQESLGTIFKPVPRKLKSKKRWLAFHQKTKGCIFIDQGAKEAVVKKGKSLLPIGIVKVEGNFKKGDLVSVKCGKEEIAKGIVNYCNESVDEIKGKKSVDIAKMLKKDFYKDVIHRDNMVIV